MNDNANHTTGHTKGQHPMSAPPSQAVCSPHQDSIVCVLPAAIPSNGSKGGMLASTEISVHALQ